MRLTETPERDLVRRATIPGALAVCLGFGLGLIAGIDVGISAALGVAFAVLVFSGQGLALAWAAGISPAAVQVVALGGFVVLMGLTAAVMFPLSLTDWFSALSFGLALVPATIILLSFWAVLALKGLGGMLVIPPRQDGS
jgi:hypothetical protein